VARNNPQLQFGLYRRELLEGYLIWTISFVGRVRGITPSRVSRVRIWRRQSPVDNSGYVEKTFRLAAQAVATRGCAVGTFGVRELHRLLPLEGRYQVATG
jgi:hypothetical protein